MDGLGARLSVEGDTNFPQVAIDVLVLAPDEPIGMYHWDAEQYDFVVLSGEALLIVEGARQLLSRPRGTLGRAAAVRRHRQPRDQRVAASALLPADRRSRAIALVGPPALPRKEAPVLAALELTPTSALFSSTSADR